MGLLEDDKGFALYLDSQLKSYQAFDLRRGIWSTLGPSASWLKLFKSVKEGTKIGLVQGDTWQQGGTFVISPDHRVLYAYQNEGTGDHANPQDIVAALSSN
eukprot:TRINITY_DN1933_c0_g1_i2.p1 TRINITY_DN1933_c0_g1~~TRINITY_DN1933_c0_g1_i2.p1  ORF type:complete len:101 (-),score=23.66 TRINITY_DN1933_c0_g1_i2:97-399(-)